MTPQEFKSWFDGFTEAFGGEPPTSKQWKRIKTRVSEIDGRPVTEHVYVDRYWHYPQPWYQPPSYPWTVICGTSETTCGNSADMNTTTVEFNSLAAMNALGRADAQSLSITG